MAAVVMAGIFLIQALALGLFASALLRAAEGAWLLGDVLIGFAIFWGVAPALLCGVWVYLYWLPALRRHTGRLRSPSGESPGVESRNDI